MGLRAVDLFVIILISQLFYAGAITLILHGLPADADVFATGFSDVTSDLTLNEVSSTVQDNLVSQTNIPILDVGALVFYSGNIIIDLLLHFTFALPEMIGLLINGIAMLFNIDNTIVVTVQLFAFTITVVLYFISIISLLTNVRAGRVI